MGKAHKLKSVQKERCLPTVIQAHSFVCGCFGIGEKDLDAMLQFKRQNTPNPDKHFPQKWWRNTAERAEAENARWAEAVLTIQREALYDRIRREKRKPLFSFTGKVTEEIVFSLLKLYEKLLPELNAEGLSKENVIWTLVENVFVPTVFIKLGQEWRSGLGAEFQGEKCWFLPVKSDGGTLKPIPRVLGYWLRTTALSSGHRASSRFVRKIKMEDEKTFNKRRSLKKRFDRWRSGEDLPTLFDLHNFVDQAATEVDWLDNPQEWKARFTLAHAMQNACDEMDELFKDIYVYVDSSLKLTKMIKQVSEEGIVCDDEKVLADPYRFFAARLWQLKVKQDGNWEKLVAGTPESKPGSFPKFSSVEEDERYRKKMLREMNPGNRFLQAIMKMSTSDGCLRSNDFSAQNFIALDKYLFELGVHELNRIFKKGQKGAGKY